MPTSAAVRLFPGLPAWQPGTPHTPEQLDAAIRAYAATLFADTPIDASRVPAGYTYIGQFVNHDLTHRPDPNANTLPRLNLSCVYGRGPDLQPELYTTSSKGNAQGGGQGTPFYLVLGSVAGSKETDLPRAADGTAKIADPRNDQHIILSQLHLAFLRLHNRVLRAFAEGRKPDQAAFDRTREAIVRTYQYLLWNDFVARLVQLDAWQNTLRVSGPAFEVRTRIPGANGAVTGIPVEFEIAAFRFGHAMIRPSYQLNLPLAADRRLLFSVNGEPDLSGGKPLKRGQSVQWDWFLQYGSSAAGFPQKARRIQPVLAATLALAPARLGGTVSVAEADLLAGVSNDLPAGSAIATALGEAPLVPTDAEAFTDTLWIYLLREARERTVGERLGPVGSAIVAETLARVLRDSGEWFAAGPGWHPGMDGVLHEREGQSWAFTDLIRASGAPVTAGDIDKLAK